MSGEYSDIQCKLKDFDHIGKIKKIYKNKPKPIFVLAGCVAQAESSIVFEKSDYVDIVVGTPSGNS